MFLVLGIWYSYAKLASFEKSLSHSSTSKTVTLSLILIGLMRSCLTYSHTVLSPMLYLCATCLALTNSLRFFIQLVSLRICGVFCAVYCLIIFYAINKIFYFYWISFNITIFEHYPYAKFYTFFWFLVPFLELF